MGSGKENIQVMYFNLCLLQDFEKTHLDMTHVRLHNFKCICFNEFSHKLDALVVGSNLSAQISQIVLQAAGSAVSRFQTRSQQSFNHSCTKTVVKMIESVS